MQVQQTVRLDFTLQVGQVSESVEVKAVADQLQAENATVGTVIENKGIAELPLNGRNYLNLVALSPNTNTLSPASGQAGSRQGGDRANQSISAAGQRIMFNYFTLDGVINTDPNFNTYVVLPSIDALQEFKVQTGVYPAEFGHEATQINVLTKSGGNQYHGALFEFLRNDELDADALLVHHQSPGEIALQVERFRFRDRRPGPHSQAVQRAEQAVLHGQLRGVAENGRTSRASIRFPPPPCSAATSARLNTTIYDPNTKTPFAGNIIPTSRLDPISQKLLQYYAPANIAGAGARRTTSSAPIASPQNRDGFVLRMDFVESSKSQWSGRYSWGDENQATQGLTLGRHQDHHQLRAVHGLQYPHLHAQPGE